MAKALFLGLDCGGSTTRARVIDDQGQTVFEGRSGPANLASTPPDLLRQHVAEAITDCPTVDAVCGAFAGLLTPDDERRATDLLAGLTHAPRIAARPDYHATLAACPRGTTLCVIAGTGSLIASKASGDVVKSGGGGPLLGDDGSAFSIARAALRQMQIEFLSPGESNFAHGLATHFGSANLNKAQAAIYAADHPAQLVARFAPLVVKDFLAGSEFAQRAIHDANQHLFELILDHIAFYHGQPAKIKVVLAGGVWEIDDRYTRYWSDQLRARLTRVPEPPRTILIKSLTDPPVLGACRIAAKLS